MELCLGTAQFGLDYGINNSRGKIPPHEIPKILDYAHNNGINTLDSASAYGSSESILGEALASTLNKFKVVTKYPANTELRPLEWITTSLRLLKTKSIYGYLFHNYSIFEKHPDYIDDFVKIKESNMSEKIGFSLYHPTEAEYIIKNNIPCDIVQVPYNILDQRFTYVLPRLKERGIEIFVRSIFLQGLFFIKPENLDNRFNSVKNILLDINHLAEDNTISIASLCLCFTYFNQDISFIVIGVDSLDNLKNNINCRDQLKNVNINHDCFTRFSVSDENIILPFNW